MSPGHTRNYHPRHTRTTFFCSFFAWVDVFESLPHTPARPTFYVPRMIKGLSVLTTAGSINVVDAILRMPLLSNKNTHARGYLR